jgi:signal peptidase I
MKKEIPNIRQQYKVRVFSHTIMSALISIFMFADIIAVMLVFVLSINKVSGNGMDPEIKDGSIVVGNRVAYKERDPQRGDVILSQGHIYRIIGLPDEQVKIFSGHVYINGKELNEKYTEEATYPEGDYDIGNYSLDDSTYFVMCDKRDCYDGSREGIGVRKNDIASKIIIVL